MKRLGAPARELRASDFIGDPAELPAPVRELVERVARVRVAAVVVVFTGAALLGACGPLWDAMPWAAR